METRRGNGMPRTKMECYKPHPYYDLFLHYLASMDCKKEKSFKCLKEGCVKSFTLATNLRRHMKSHEAFTIPKVKSFVCSKDCSKEFPTMFNLIQHEKTCTRPKENINTCFICKKEFSKVSNLRRHLRTHSQGKKKKTKKQQTKIKITKSKKTPMFTFPSMAFDTDQVTSRFESKRKMVVLD